jgi:hypothetical protein
MIQPKGNQMPCSKRRCDKKRMKGKRMKNRKDVEDEETDK